MPLPLHWGLDGLPEAPQRMLLVQISAMGDQVQTLPAVSDIAARWPGLRIDWAVDSRFAAIPRCHPAVDQVFALPFKQLQQTPRDLGLWRQLVRALRALRRQRYDLVWDPHSVLKSSLICRSARTSLRVGYQAADCGGEPSAARAYQLHFARPAGLHGTEGRRAFAAAVLQTDPQRPVQYRLTESLGEAACAPAEVLFAHGVSRPHREWAQQHWIALGHELAARAIPIKLTWGNPRERARAEAIVAALPPGSARIDPPPTDLAALLRYIAASRAVVGVDTGFTHFAAALARPLLGLFSAATGPEVLLPESWALTRTLGGNGSDPTPQQAWAALADLLGVAPTSSSSS